VTQTVVTHPLVSLFDDAANERFGTPHGHLRQGIGGYEGGPPQFDLRAAAIAARSQKGESYGHRGIFGNRGSDGECSYYNDPESGASVLTGNC
jgi:hypothetical protein